MFKCEFLLISLLCLFVGFSRFGSVFFWLIVAGCRALVRVEIRVLSGGFGVLVVESKFLGWYFFFIVINSYWYN